ncbi:class I SAM-dependent methyltransferase, partial [Candidatus Bathyarchaeota archaeon]|nr:class I SAM-dependent methyltransferase [Candidatus Bathyarchaeota archaeon]
MEPEVMEAVSNVLEGLSFRYGVDLGCGEGVYAPILKSHVSYLVGVDKKRERLAKAILNGYDCVIASDIMEFKIPDECDIVFLFDVIEHLDKPDGVRLLRRLSDKNVMLTTPCKYFPIALNGHKSLWTVEELSYMGFKTYIIEIRDILKKPVYGDKI